MINKTKLPVLTKHIIRSYARLSENSRVRAILKDNLPNILYDKKFTSTLDETSKRWLNNIFRYLNIKQTNDINDINVITNNSNNVIAGNNTSTTNK
jgi:ABC-type iron transport system FetAB ATPase subunit